MITELIISNLACPMAIAFLPSGAPTFIERDRNQFNVLRYGTRGIATVCSPTVVPSTVTTGGDGGLLGLAIDPNFATNAYVYLVQTVAFNGGQTTNGNQVTRYVYDGTTKLLREPLVLLNYDSGKLNNGGCLKFGPEGCLYLATGNLRNAFLSQDHRSLNGKILRFNTLGQIPSDNPYIDSYVWASGFRNPLGMCWNASQMYATDTGSKGYDKINLIVKGMDYGYPSVSSSSVAPVLSSGQYETWQPCGICAVRGSLYFGALGGSGYSFSSLNKTTIIANTLTTAEHNLVSTYGRIRDCVYGPDGAIYFSTSNNDGVGNGSADSIYRVSVI